MNREWSLLAALLVATLLLWSCNNGTSAGAKKINLSIVSQTLYGGRADKLIPIRQGERVTIHVTSDEPMTVFLHGYDVQVKVKPETSGEMQFTADVAGRFALMIHSLGENGDSRVEILLGLVDVQARR